MITEQISQKPPKVHDRRWWALAVLSFSLVIIGMDNVILNVALPTLTQELDASTSQLQWMVDAYILAFAGFLLTMGALGDRFGRKLLLDIGLLIFVGASVAAAWAGSAQILILARIVLGFGAAMIMPATLSIVTAIFPPAERARAIGVWTAMAGIGLIIGPLIGGWLLERFWWGSVFLINVPVVGAAFIAGMLLVPETKDPAATRLDPVGTLLSIGGFSSLVFGTIELPDNSLTDSKIWGSLVLGAFLLAVFVVWEARAKHPMLQMTFFRDPRFSAANVAITLVSFALFGVIFLLTQQLQFVLGYEPLEAGLRIMPIATLAIGAPLAGRLVEHLGTKTVVVAGLVIVAAGLWLLSRAEIADGYAPVGWSLAVIGFGMGATMAPATDSIMGSLPVAKAGVGSAVNSTIRQVGGALGVAVLGSALTSSYRNEIEPSLAQQPERVAAAAEESVGAALVVASRMGQDGAELRSAARIAFTEALSQVVLVAVAAVIVGAIVALVFLPARPAELVEPPH